MSDNKNEETTASPEAEVAFKQQFKTMSLMLGILLVLNVGMTIAGLVIGLQVKSKVDELEEVLGPLIEMAEGYSDTDLPFPTL